MKIKNMAASGQSGKWLAGKQDVTDMAIRAVAEHCHLTGNEYSFTLNDGRVITLAVTEVQSS